MDTTKKLTPTQIAIITIAWQLDEAGDSALEPIQLLKSYYAINYDDITIDNDDGIHITGPTATRYHSGGSTLLIITNNN